MNNGAVGCWTNYHGLLSEPMKEQPASFRTTAVKTKREFVEVIIEMLLLNTTLKRAEQPALEQRGDVVDARHDLVGRIITAANVRGDVPIARSRKPEARNSLSIRPCEWWSQTPQSLR